MQRPGLEAKAKAKAGAFARPFAKAGAAYKANA